VFWCADGSVVSMFAFSASGPTPESLRLVAQRDRGSLEGTGGGEEGR
jgi:hypothetical protein